MTATSAPRRISSSTIDAEVDRIRSFERFTRRIITDRNSLTTELARTAVRGHAINVEERNRAEELAPLVQNAATEVASLVIRF